MRTNRLLVAAFVVLFAAVACTSDERDQPATPTATAPTEVEVEAAVEPTATPWVPPPPVSSRLGIPRVSPGTDYPSIGLREDGIPLAAEGRLVVYAKELRGDSKLEVVVFDLAAGERLSAFPLEANGQFSVQLAGNRVLVSFGRELWSYALDGSDGRLLNDELPGIQMLPAPDGRHVAITGWDEERLASVAIIEVETGARLVALDLVERLPDWLGEPYPARWLSNEELLVGGLCSCDSSPEGYFDVIVGLDGTMEREPDDLREFEAARLELAATFLLGCGLSGYAGGRTLRLVDVETGRVLAEASEDAPVLLGGEVSPDGAEVLVTVLAADAELRMKLNEALDRGDCFEGTETNYGEADRVLGLLGVGAQSIEPVATRLDVLERWYGESLPVFTCGGEQRAGAVTTGWFDHVEWRDPAGFGHPWGFDTESCEGRGASIDMQIGPVPVDTDAEGYRVLGFLDPRASSED